MNHKLILTLIVFVLCGSVFGQDVKLRIGGNYGKFNKEIGPKEVNHPLVDALSNPNHTDFTSNFEPDFEAEVMLLWSQNIETGIELELSKFSGFNDVPPYYNYIFSNDFPDINHVTTAPISYKSSATSLIANFRYYFVPKGNVNPFFKVFGGLAFVGAELNYRDKSVWDQAWDKGTVGVLYAIGTKNSSKPKEVALHYGGGAGINFKVSDQFSIYVDGTASVINSDKIDGIPNYDYSNKNGQETLKPVGNKSFITQFSLGLVYSTGTNLGLNKNWGKHNKGSKIKHSGRTLPWRPFYRQK